MRIFILEDDFTRRVWFSNRLAGNDLTYADSCAQFEEVYRPPYDLICLDHDLGGRQMSDHEDNGEEFAKLICNPTVAQIGTKGPFAVIVHSFNPEGAHRIAYTMRALCPNVFKAPFASKEFRIALDVILAHHLQ